MVLLSTSILCFSFINAGEEEEKKTAGKVVPVKTEDIIASPEARVSTMGTEAQAADDFVNPDDIFERDVDESTEVLHPGTGKRSIEFKIFLENESDVRVSVTGPDGKAIYERLSHTKEKEFPVFVNFQYAAEGIYTIYVESDEGITIKKLLNYKDPTTREHFLT